jgi:hypothetical protein
MWRGTTCKLRPPLRKYWAALPRVMIPQLFGFKTGFGCVADHRRHRVCPLAFA